MRLGTTFRMLSTILALVAGCGDGAGETTGTGGAAGQGGGGAGGGGAGGGGAGQGGGVAEEDAAAVLARYLTGRFDSSADAKQNPKHIPVQLYTCPISVPELGERVLYVEQALLANLDKPYRQRLYVVEPGADPKTLARSRVFEFDAPASVVGLCDDPAKATITAADVEERQGCLVSLSWNGVELVGGTEGKACESTLNGASYATTQVTITKDEIRSWDQGFDANDTQVWGATDGPYLFERKTPLEEP